MKHAQAHTTETLMAHGIGSKQRRQHPDEELIARYIGPHPANPGKAEYWLKDAGIPVWAIIGQWRADHEDIAQAAAAYRVPQEAVEAAIAYYRAHKELIDDRLAANEAA
jgi:uncharacterized protein (DUF433 family)